MHSLDADKNASRTPIDNFHCTVMLFELKNVCATYQGAMNAILQDILHDCLRYYVDNIVLKYKENYNHVNDQTRNESFEICFDVSCKKFLGFTVYRKN